MCFECVIVCNVKQFLWNDLSFISRCVRLITKKKLPNVLEHKNRIYIETNTISLQYFTVYTDCSV